MIESNLHHHRKEDGRGKFFMIRNIMNIIFILGAIAGLLAYFCWSKENGTYIILISMAFKFFECIFRFIK